MHAAETAADRSATAPVGLAARLQGGLARDTLGTLGINVAQTLLSFAATLTLTRLLGADGFGAYAFAFAWAMVLSVPSVVGMTPLVVRNVAAYRERAAWGHVRGIVRRCNQVVAVTSLLVAGGAAAAGWLLIDPGSGLRTPYLVGMALVPLIALTTMRQAVMQGLGRVVVGRVPETLVAPGLLLALLLGAAAVTGSHSATLAVSLQVVATAIAFGLGAWLLVRSLPARAKAAEPAYETAIWVRGGLALLAAGLAMALNGQLGTILLGAFEGSTEAGVFAGATRVTLFAGFLYLAVTYPLMPTVARLHATGAGAELERVVRRAGRAVFIASLPLLVALVAFAPQVLSIFGDGFDEGATALRLLIAGEAVKIVIGFAGLVLVMTARESAFARIIVASTALNIGLSLVLIPSLGTEGAALATALSLALMSVAFLIAVRRGLAISTAAIPLPGGRRADSRGGA